MVCSLSQWTVHQACLHRRSICLLTCTAKEEQQLTSRRSTNKQNRLRSKSFFSFEIAGKGNSFTSIDLSRADERVRPARRGPRPFQVRNCTQNQHRLVGAGSTLTAFRLAAFPLSVIPFFRFFFLSLLLFFSSPLFQFLWFSATVFLLLFGRVLEKSKDEHWDGTLDALLSLPDGQSRSCSWRERKKRDLSCCVFFKKYLFLFYLFVCFVFPCFLIEIHNYVIDFFWIFLIDFIVLQRQTPTWIKSRSRRSRSRRVSIWRITNSPNLWQTKRRSS